MERAARIHRYGPPEALIRHTPIGLNFVEVYLRRGTFETPALPAVLGNEGAGVVEAVGPGVNDVSIGDRAVYADAARRVCHSALLSGGSPRPYPCWGQ